MVIPDRAQFRDRSRYAVAVASELITPLLRVYASRHAHGDVRSPSTWRSGLIIGSGHIGDVLYRTCSLAHLLAGLPDCQWAYLTTNDGADILRGTPKLAEVLPFNNESAVDFLPPHGSEELRDRMFDAVICTDNIQQYHSLLLATRLGIPNRAGFDTKGFSGLLTLPVRTGRAPWPAQIRSMFEAVTGTLDSSELRPRLYLDTDELRASRAVLSDLAFSDAPLTVAVSMTSRQRIGVFPKSLFIAILRGVLRQCPDARVVLTGTQAENAALTSIATELGPRALVLAGQLSLRQFAGFLSLCDVFLGADSGPRHLANAAAVPVFFVRNMAVPEIEAGAYCESETDIAPAGQYLLPETATQRLAGVDHDAVASAMIAAGRRRRANTTQTAIIR